MLETHNAARRDVGLGPVSWDASLASDADVYAQKLARSGKFEHDSQTGVTPRQGENLWMGTAGAFDYAEMSGSWIDEKRYFREGIFPDNSTTGRWSDVGHYTQIIWHNSVRIGCAVAANTRDEYLVCRYAPAGNVVGRNPLKP